jgi:hypothetical protein
MTTFLNFRDHTPRNDHWAAELFKKCKNLSFICDSGNPVIFLARDWQKGDILQVMGRNWPNDYLILDGKLRVPGRWRATGSELVKPLSRVELEIKELF